MPYAESLQRYIRAEFPGSVVNCILKADPMTTGNFEVTLNGVLIHSKKSGGKGRCEKAAERENIFDKIRELLTEMQLEIPARDEKAVAAAASGDGCFLL